MSSSWSLQQSVFAALSADAGLTALLGGARIYDEVPQGAAFPYVTLGQSTVRDWSTGADAGSDPGHEHILTLHVWSRGRGKKEAHAILDAARAVLHDQPLALTGHRLVNLRHELSEVRRDPDGFTVHGLLRLRATTEPVS